MIFGTILVVVAISLITGTLGLSGNGNHILWLDQNAGKAASQARNFSVNWWAHQDSNLGPMDSHNQCLSTLCGLSHHRLDSARILRLGAGRSSLSLRALRDSISSPQVVCTFGGAPPAWLKVANLEYTFQAKASNSPVHPGLLRSGAPFDESCSNQLSYRFHTRFHRALYIFPSF